MVTVLQQTLRSLCFETGWCYAVFWKLKRRSRMVLIWEDGYYECKKPFAISNLSSTLMAPSSLLADGNGCLETVVNPLEQGVSGRQSSCVEEQIGLAVAKMSYQVYALGEGIIGRVAFTEKHNWVYGNGAEAITDANSRSNSNNWSVVEKHPVEWQTQFAVGIKTIVVIAVPQGVVQLGSTQMITENPELVNHIKAVFHTLHGVHGAFASDLLSEVKGGKGYACPTYMTASMSPLGPSAAVGRHRALRRANPTQRNMEFITGSAIDSMECRSSGRVALKSISAYSEATESGVTAQIMAQKSKQHEVHSNLEPPKLQGSGTGPTPLGLSPTDVSVSGNWQLPQLTSQLGCTYHKIMEHGLIKEACLPCEDILSPNKTMVDLLPQVHLDASTTLHNSLLLPSNESHQQVYATSRPVADEFAERSDGSLKTSPANRAEQLFMAHLDVQAAVSFGQDDVARNQLYQNGIPFENQFYSQDGWCPSTKIHGQNLCPESCKAKNIAKSEELMRKVDQLISSSWDLPPDHLNSLCVEGMAKSPIAQGLFSSSDSSLDQKVWNMDGFDKSVSNSDLQSNVDGPIKTAIRDLNSAYNNIPVSIGYNCIHGGGLNDLEKYLALFSSRQDRNWNCSLAIGDELSQALVPTVKKVHDIEVWEEILLQLDGKQMESNDQSMVGCPGYPDNWAEAAIAQSLVSSTGGDEFNKDGVSYLSGSNSELLDSAIGTSKISQGTIQNPDDNFSCKAVVTGIDNGHLILKLSDNVDWIPKYLNTGTEQPRLNHIQGSLQHGDLEKQNSVMLDSDPQGSLPLQISLKDLSSKGMLSSWMEGQCMKSENMQSPQAKKSGESMSLNRKRARPAESTRPRPKDRQQIQDRVRELREIVPNGSKCSIDALLEKTIKHMLFLQSVTQHADKLKQSGELKVLKDGTRLLPWDKKDSGTSWALELGCHGMGCPIIVENLNQPRQMLVEMMCEEREQFFKIADIIKGLDLTILKGIMESRADKVWARLVVEANRDVHRVEILLSLMPLLQPDMKNSSSVTSQAGPTRSESMDSSPKWRSGDFVC